MTESEIYAAFRRTSVATLTTVLRQKGLHRVWMHGPKPIVPNQPRLVGPAFTMRFTPIREDILTAEAITGPRSPRAILETIPKDFVVVVDAMGRTRAGVFGDIICLRMQYLGIAGLVTDGPIRDAAAMRNAGWPVWANGAAGPSSPAAFFCADSQVIIACGGVSVFPRDIIVADEDGVVVVPAAMAREIAETAVEKEEFEAWVSECVKSGESLNGLYPPDERTKARFAARAGK
jgi:regulator of RNase E activity RraA